MHYIAVHEIIKRSKYFSYVFSRRWSSAHLQLQTMILKTFNVKFNLYIYKNVQTTLFKTRAKCKKVLRSHVACAPDHTH